MVEIADLRDCTPSGLFYGGRAPRTEGDILGVRGAWIAKYPRTTYVICEQAPATVPQKPGFQYLGSHIYGLWAFRSRDDAGISGREDRLCLPRLYLPERAALRGKEIKNALSDDDAGFNSAPADGRGRSAQRCARRH